MLTESPSIQVKDKSPTENGIYAGEEYSPEQIWKFLIPIYVSVQLEYACVIIIRPIIAYFVQTFTDENFYVGLNMSVFMIASFIGTLCMG